jgi:GntR family transcriptional regulator
VRHHAENLSPATAAGAAPGSHDPLYLSVYRSLASEINRGTYAPGSRLPSERWLSEHFEVSRVTLRKALRLAVAERLIATIDGRRGWYVAGAEISEPLDELMSFSAMAVAKGLTPTAHVLSLETRPSSLDEADALAVAPGSPILDLERLRMLDGIPVLVHRTRVPLARVPIPADTDFETSSLYEVFAACGMAPAVGDLTVEAAGADARHAELLDVKEGSAVLVVREITFDAANRIIEDSELVYRGDRYRLRTRLRVGLTSTKSAS